MEQARPRSLWPVRALTAVLAVGAVAAYGLIASSHFSAGSAISVPWPALAACFAIAEVYALHLRFRGETHTFSINDIVLILGLFAVAHTALVGAQLLGAAIALGVIQRRSLLKLTFNLSHFVLGTEIAILVFRSLATSAGPLAVRNWVAVIAAAGAASLLQFGAIAIAISVAEGRWAARELGESFVFGLLGTAVNTTLGLVVVIVLSQSLAAAVLLIGPIAVVFVAYRAYLSEHAKTEGLQFLYRASEILSGARDLEGGLVALLDFARETFHAEIAEVVLFGERDEPIGYRTCSGPGERGLRLAPCTVQHVSAIVDLVAGSGDVIVYKPQAGSEFAECDGIEIESMLLGTFEDETGVRGAAYVARPRGTVNATFDKDERHLFETFVNHLGTTLEKSRLSSSLAQLRALKQELAYQAYHDSLTGLANRLMLRDLVDDALAAAAREGGKVAVMFIDLDDFKTVNDTMGHAAGDALLEEVARRIEASIEGLGTAARLGGDEFAVLVPRVANDAEVRAAADRILVALGDPVAIEGQSVIAQASIGIATHVGAADAAELMQHADVAMYTAKRNGKGRFDEFEPDMSLTVARRHQLKVGLERAIANQEFVMHYQPVIDVATGGIRGTEALLRWKDPTRGLMPPAEFVGVAEETGLIVPIGRHVLQAACRQAAAWSSVAPDLRMFVNLSTRQLCDPDIVGDVRRAMRDTALKPNQLVLEVTETAMMRDIDEARATLIALKDLGVGVAIDDFGTGFSSLSYLRQLPIDVLKIAKPIIDAICDSPQDAAFVKGIIELGHVVGLKVVAEGVERVEQYAHLIDMGCDYVQGYYYAPSMEPSEVLDILRAATGPSAPARSIPASPSVRANAS
jgi:diguanylate cyclase (GGDEF)-like protein